MCANVKCIIKSKTKTKKTLYAIFFSLQESAEPALLTKLQNPGELFLPWTGVIRQNTTGERIPKVLAARHTAWKDPLYERLAGAQHQKKGSEAT